MPESDLVHNSVIHIQTQRPKQQQKDTSFDQKVVSPAGI
jgi:hypothetical protein